ncbi:MAG: polysaccharide deacetylase family protein [Jatrophihabitantaceae bacterium]
MTVLGYGAATTAAAHLVPSVAAIGTLRRAVLPGLAGRGRDRHIALTFDDGPAPESTPRFLDELARLDVRATFFVLGAHLAAHPRLGRQLVAGGHEVAVHGWSHRVHLLRTPWTIRADLDRAVDCIASVTGAAPRHWRPPHGIPTGTSLWAARHLGLRAVLWTADGRDWQAEATAASVQARVESLLRGGGTVLLHDADTMSAPGSWRSALGALAPLVARWRARGWQVGPLAEHWGAHAAG